MAMTNITGRALSKAKLQKAAGMFRPTETEHILNAYWEDIPDDRDYTDVQKLEFIICMTPNPGMHSVEGLWQLLRMDARIKLKTYGTNPKEYPGAHINMAHRAERLCPDALKLAVDSMRPHKHVPEHIVSNGLFVACVCMMQFIDSLYKECASREDVDRIICDDAVFAKTFTAYAKALEQNHAMMSSHNDAGI